MRILEYQLTSIKKLMSKFIGRTDRSSQTEDHAGRKFDPNYQWNEWDLRRQALHLAKMRNKMTHSSQTYVTFNQQLKEDKSQIGSFSGSTKANSGTQTLVAKAVGTNSTLESSKSLIIGLRGETPFPVEHIVLKDLISNSN